MASLITFGKKNSLKGESEFGRKRRRKQFSKTISNRLRAKLDPN